MSTTRISGTDSGMRLTLVRIRSASSTASARGMKLITTGPGRGQLGVDLLLDLGAEPLR